MCETEIRLRFGSSTGALLLVVLGLFGLTGCGAPTDRLEISGKVTLDGEPLSGGSIRFTSVGSDHKLTSGAMVNYGEFRIPREQGLRPGTYHLEINAPDNDAPPVMARATPGGPGISVAPERIPPAYNIDSEKTIEVTADGDNHFVFDIVSQSAQ